MARKPEDCWDIKDNRFTKEIFEEMRQSLQQPSFGEKTIFYGIDKGTDSSEEEDEDNTPQFGSSIASKLSQKSIEKLIHRKLQKYSETQPTILGYFLGMIIYLVGTIMSNIVEIEISYTRLTVSLVPIIVTLIIFIVSLTKHYARKGTIFKYGLNIARHIVHFTFV